ncbi:MAG: hypothetical protein KAW09_02320 [Thermoplasmata archaeon]|nr:hypothetical protein [Thermoplasmata archaeon]
MSDVMMIEVSGDIREQARRSREMSDSFATWGMITFISAGVWVLVLCVVGVIYGFDRVAWNVIGWGFLGLMIVGMYLRYKGHKALQRAHDLESKQDFWATKGPSR